MWRDVSVDRPERGSDHPLGLVLAAACCGIVVDRQLAFSPRCWSVVLVTLLALWVVLRQGWQRGAAICVLASVAALAGLWHHDRWRLFPADEIGRYAGDQPVPVCARVVALEPPRWSPAERPSALSTMAQGELTRLAVRVVALRQGDCWQPVSGRVMLLVDGLLVDDAMAGVLRGDTLEVAGMLVRARLAANPNEPNAAATWRRQRQLALVHCGHAACVQRLARGSEGSVLRQLGRVRVWAERVLDRHLAAPQSALAAALLLGTRERLDRSTVETFFVSGTVHLLSISGSHVAILASIMWVVIRLDWFPRRRMLLLTCVLAVAYALLTGAQPPVVRATILIVVYCLARWTGRRAVAWNSLAAAGLVTLGLSPGGLYDIGTQLSYLAVATLVAHRPLVYAPCDPDPLRKLVERGRPGWWRAMRSVRWGVWQLTLASTMIWLVGMPLVAYRFHLVPFISVLANLWLWLPIPVALFSGLAVLVCAPVPPLAAGCGWVCQQSLVLTQWLMEVAAAPRWGHAWVAGPPLWLVLVFYSLLAAFQCGACRLPARWWCALLAGWLSLCIATGSTAARMQRMLWPQGLRCSFVAVGHGTSVLVELPGGQTLLYDAGRMGSPQAAVQPISAVLWWRRITHLDAIVLSHADADHFNAVPELLNRFSVGAVYVSPLMFQNQAAALDALRASIRAAGVPVEPLYEGARLVTELGGTVQVLHPPPGGCHGGDNSNSIVLHVCCDGHSVLLTGDLEEEGLEELLAELPWSCDVLLAPHHGSRRSRPGEVVAWAAPAWVVVSEGAVANAHQLLADYQADGAQACWTHRDGMIQVVWETPVAGETVPARVGGWRTGPLPAAGYSLRSPD
ncbi:MAG: ComEC/Rec2 family competence protein [Planctomycetaceae bacterium]|nr:ComEC/Rec2 family competence protein [Planctomycetaceae bacterium]